MAVTKGITISGTDALLHFPAWGANNGSGLRPIICQHGHGGDYLQIEQGRAFAGHPEYWADRGYVVGCISTGDQWASAAAMTALTNLANYLNNTVGAAGKIGMAGWSMGGLHVMRWYLENPTRVAVGWVVSPALDLDADEANASWTAEIDAIYGGTHSSYLTQGSPRSPRNNVASFRGGPKWQIVHATDDTIIPYSNSTGFISAVNDPAVTMRSPDITGNHQGGLINISPRESWEWIRTNWAA